ncbi:FHA domain-containing protein [Proteobacteria bacterium 005FR1]|nr:FHA domain-containing protein [Proteobacteria bacterium 005FR1]
MFADVSGSSALYKQQGNVSAKQVIDRTIDLMRDITERNGGRVVKTIGDEIMARFEKAEDACRAATAIQQQCQLANLDHPGDQTAVRIGMDFGHILLDEGDVFGETVNDAACVARIARANQIVITQSLVDALPSRLQEYCQQFDRVNIKGEDSSSLIYRFLWESPAQAAQATQVMSANHVTQKIGIRQLELQYLQQVFIITSEDVPFAIGRDHRSAHLQVDSSLASRDHCRIELRRGKFVLVDHSTNGTYVKGPDQPEIYLRREELPLIGEGTIAIGRRAGQEAELTIHYRV